ncbi:MAG: helix-turn-helix transcriptional regulator [Rectinemataceae bacterium]
MEFWDRIAAYVAIEKTSWRWIADKVGKSETTVSGWRGTGVLPRADDAVKIANAVGMSVEYLVTGKEGIAIPARLKIVVDDLLILPEDSLEHARVVVHLLAEKERAAEIMPRTVNEK